jgi:cell division protease FtsH
LVERHLYGEDYLNDMLAVTMGGRASELVVVGQGSTGAANDLAKATELATKMVREFGLSAALGPVGYPSGGSAFLGDGGAFSTRPFAEATQAAIDNEVAKMLRQAEERAIGILTEHRDVLDQVVAHLLDKETIDGADVYALAHRPVPTSGEGMTVAPGRAAAASTAHPASTVGTPDGTAGSR